ncbi:MAG: DUF362 domain-containing protein [Chloroflexi bacterium]|nr:DUF362 domain-containing protein [Chloroflexota bacterium]
MTEPAYRVRAVRCDHQGSDDEVYQALRRATDPLDRAWDKLERAKRITVKFNQAWAPERRVVMAGQSQELVSEKVARAVLRLLRERTRANIACVEISTGMQRTAQFESYMTLLPVLREFDVPIIDGNRPPFRLCLVPGGGSMFSQYLLPSSTVDTDAFVSVAKLKNHRFMGVTMCLKNLFGLPPLEPHGRYRGYFHHLIRLPNVLVDLGRMVQPTLNIADALVSQAGAEWGGEGRVSNTLIAGDHVIATDACGAHLMGYDTRVDWPTEPFGSDRNWLLIAERASFGTARLEEIDFISEVERPIGEYYRSEWIPQPRQAKWRRTMSQQALHYRDHPGEYAEFAGEFVLMQDHKVIWHHTNSNPGMSRTVLSAQNQDSGLWMKYIDPEEAEGEHYEVYEDALANLDQLGL